MRARRSYIKIPPFTDSERTGGLLGWSREGEATCGQLRSRACPVDVVERGCGEQVMRSARVYIGCHRAAISSTICPLRGVDTDGHIRTAFAQRNFEETWKSMMRVRTNDFAAVQITHVRTHTNSMPKASASWMWWVWEGVSSGGCPIPNGQATWAGASEMDQQLRTCASTIGIKPRTSMLKNGTNTEPEAPCAG